MASSMQRRRARYSRKERLESLDKALQAAPATHTDAEREGAEMLVLDAEARSRVDHGSVWGLADDLRALGKLVDDDVKGLLTRVVAQKISVAGHDVKAIRYDRHAPVEAGEWTPETEWEEVKKVE